MRPDAVVGVLQEGNHGLGFLERVEDLSAQEFVAQLADFGPLFAQCLPDRLRAIAAGNVLWDARKRHMASASASITPRLLMRRATFSARYARLCASISVRIHSLRPSCVWACTKLKIAT